MHYCVSVESTLLIRTVKQYRTICDKSLVSFKIINVVKSQINCSYLFFLFISMEKKILILSLSFTKMVFLIVLFYCFTISVYYICYKFFLYFCYISITCLLYFHKILIEHISFSGNNHIKQYILKIWFTKWTTMFLTVLLFI